MTRPYRLGKRGDAAAQTRQHILEAAVDLIVTDGFDAVSMDSVAARAGASRPTVYRCFGSKVGLLEAVAWHVLATAGLDRLDRARERPDARDSLRAFLRENCRMLDDAGDALRAVVDVARHEPELGEVMDTTYYGRRVDSLRQLAQRLAAERVLLPGWTTDAVVDALMVLTSVDTFESLTQHRGRTWRQAAHRLNEMTTAFVR